MIFRYLDDMSIVCVFVSKGMMTNKILSTQEDNTVVLKLFYLKSRH